MNAAQPAEQTIDAICDTSNVLWELWKRTSDNLSEQELEWFAKATEQARMESRHLRDVVMGMANHEDQELHKLLKSIATYADKNAAEQRRIGRPNTGHPNARAFALHLAENFDETFHCMPNEVIAACVCLKYPQLENPPNADTIRDWRGAK